MTKPKEERTHQRDLGFLCIVALVIFNAVWLLLMPIVPSIASTTLRRFHLQTDSFALWAIQQPIPSMYNFANRCQVREFPPGLVDPILHDGEERYVNHFPTRVMTFADLRFEFLRAGEDRWYTLKSSYRGQSIESQFHAKVIGDEHFELIRLPVDDDARGTQQ